MIYDYLYHHGIKGQKWGVRRFQNKDGSLTKEGKQRRIYRDNIIRNQPYTDDVNSIVRTLSIKEKQLLGAPIDDDWIEKSIEYDIILNKAKTFVTKVENTPVSFLEIWTNGGRTGQIAIATRNDSKYRGKGYASKEVEKAVKWVDKYYSKSIDRLEWVAEVSNTGSRRLAEKYGFKLDEIKNVPIYTEEDTPQQLEGKYAFYYRNVNKPKNK